MDTPGHPTGVMPGSPFIGRGALSLAAVHRPRLHHVGVHQRQDTQHSTGAQHASCVYAAATSVVVNRHSLKRDGKGRDVLLHRVAAGDEPSQVRYADAHTCADSPA